MIYINKVVTNAPMRAIAVERDFLFFRDCEPQKLKYPTSEAMEKRIKQKLEIVDMSLEKYFETDHNSQR